MELESASRSQTLSSLHNAIWAETCRELHNLEDCPSFLSKSYQKRWLLVEWYL